MNYRARDTTQSDFGIAYTAICQQVNEVGRVMVESNMTASNSLSEIEARINQCCCNFAEARAMADLRMRLEEQTVEHYVPGFNSPFVTRQTVANICEDDQKSCTNCKWNLCYPTYKWCGADLEDPIRSCIRSERRYWVSRSKALEIQDKPTTFIDLRADLDNTPLRDLGVRRVYETEQGKTVIIEDKPKKKYTIYDLYDLTFPDDPIKKHFITVCNNIEKRYQEKKKVLDQIEAPEVRTHHVEPIPTVTIDDDMMTAYQVFMLIGGLTAIASILIAIHVILV